MMNDGNLQACSPRAGRGSSFLPSPFRAIFRSATSLASTVRSAGVSVASTISTSEEDSQREQLQWAGFDRLELGSGNVQRVLLLTYLNGFQVWDVENADNVLELVSKRDGPVAFLRVQPHPIEICSESLKSAYPLLLAVTPDVSNVRSNIGFTNGYSAVVGSPPLAGENHAVPTLVKFYSLRSHSYVHTLRFRTAIVAVRCSPRVIAVSLTTQLYCFDAATLQSTFSVLTYPCPQPGSSGLNAGYGAVAVGPRWLAYAANQTLVSNTGRVSPQHLTPSPGASPSTSPANGSLVAHYAKESSKHLAAGIVTLGDLGYKALSRYCTESVGSPLSGNSSCNGHPEYAGTVIVRDFVNKVVVSQFRAHSSPLSALCFDPSGTLLVTASIHGHNINIFRLLPVSNTNGAKLSSYDVNFSHVHLYKLSRGMTNAVIQDIAFSKDSCWIVVSSSRGTNHLFAISAFGGSVGPLTHGGIRLDCTGGPVAPMQLLPWWSNMGPLRSTQHASVPPPGTISLSVVSRIKNGNSGWRGTVTGVAAAASGRTCSSLGAVAVVFHDGRGQLDTQGGEDSLKEQLWVLSSSGHLTRYGLRLLAGTEGHSDNVSSSMPSGSRKEALDLKVMVEPLQKWDVCRKPNWVEREEKVYSSTDSTFEAAGTPNYTTKNGTWEREDLIFKEATSKDMHQWFLSNAEVQIHHFRPPIWASSQVTFHVLSGVADGGACDFGGEVQIERVDSRVVQVRKKDLVPVFDMFRNYQFGEDVSSSREVDFLSKGLLNSLSLHSAMHFGFSTDLGVLQVQHSSSESSCDSEGSPYGAPNIGLSEGHHSYQDPSTCQPINAPFCHRSLQSEFHTPRNKSQNGLIKDKKNVNAAPAGSPPMDIPYLNHQASRSIDSQVGEKPVVQCFDALQDEKRDVLPLHDKNTSMKIEGCSAISYGSEGVRLDVGCIPNAGLIGHEGFKCMETLAVTSNNRQQTACTIDEGQPRLKTTDLDNATQIVSRLKRFDLQDYDVAVEEVDSMDGNSKSEDFGGESFGGEQGEDGWEGAMFPFIEDC